MKTYKNPNLSTTLFRNTDRKAVILKTQGMMLSMISFRLPIKQKRSRFRETTRAYRITFPRPRKDIDKKPIPRDSTLRWRLPAGDSFLKRGKTPKLVSSRYWGGLILTTSRLWTRRSESTCSRIGSGRSNPNNLYSNHFNKSRNE